MRFNPKSIPQRDPRAQSCRLGEEFMVLDGKGRTLRGLNATGARIWELVDARSSAQQIAERLASEGRVPVERTLVPVLDFLTALASRELIRVAQGTTGSVAGGCP